MRATCPYYPRHSWCPRGSPKDRSTGDHLNPAGNCTPVLFRHCCAATWGGSFACLARMTYEFQRLVRTSQRYIFCDSLFTLAKFQTCFTHTLSTKDSVIIWGLPEMTRTKFFTSYMLKMSITLTSHNNDDNGVWLTIKKCLNLLFRTRKGIRAEGSVFFF